MSVVPTIDAARQRLADQEISAVDLVEQSLTTLAAWEPHVHAFYEIFADSAREQAERYHESADKVPLLGGIPIAIKDLICTREGHTTAGSRMLERFVSPYEATVVKRLKAAGAIVLGKTNLDEFAMGASNEYSAFGPAKNPWDTTRVPGGSSGGSAVAVATGEALASLGTDTGGSIRLPASFCNVAGVKPTYSRVSRFGVIAYASSFDQVGPFARTVKDVARVLTVIAGHDPHDATSATAPVPNYLDACGRDVAGLTVGVPREYLGDDVDPAIVGTIKTAIGELEQLGCVIKKISLPLMQAAVPTYYLLVKSEASSNLARYDGLRYGALDVAAADLLTHYVHARGAAFGPEVKRSILMGTYALSAGYVDAWYKQASRVRTLIRREFAAAFTEVDVIVGPVSPELPFPFGSKANDPLKMYLADLLTDPASVAGLPALSVPAGFVDNLPVGLQVIGPHFKEELLFQVGHAYEQRQPWWQRMPQLTTDH